MLRVKQTLNFYQPCNVAQAFLGMVNGFLDKNISKAGRLAFYSWVFDRDIKHGKILKVAQPDINPDEYLKVHEAFNLVIWLSPTKIGDTWHNKGVATSDIHAVVKLFGGGVGQIELPIDKAGDK